MIEEHTQFERFISLNGKKMIERTLLPYPLDESGGRKLRLLGMECIHVRVLSEQETNKTKKKQLRDSYAELVRELREYEKTLRTQFGVKSFKSKY